MALLESLVYSLKEAKFNPLTIVHALLYGATGTYLRVLKRIVEMGPQSARRLLAETYHAKVVRLDDASRLITVNRNIELRNLFQVLPYRYATNLILRNPQNIAVYDCPCRSQAENPCQPTAVCLIVGEPFTDLLRLVHPLRSRRITAPEALRILREEEARGHVHTAWFKSTMLDRFYAICNCCRCCCLGMQFLTRHRVKMLLPSGYRAEVGPDCDGCGSCSEFCQFGALVMESLVAGGVEKRCRVNAASCFGCGVCAGKCGRAAITLVADPDKGIPLNIEALSRQFGGDAEAGT